MKKINQLKFVIPLLLFGLIGCEKEIVIGTIISGGKPVGEARIFITCLNPTLKDTASIELQTDKDGQIKINAKRICNAQKYLVRVSKAGFAPVSKVYYTRLPYYVYTLTPATVVSSPTGQEVFAQDKMENCHPGIDSSKLYSIPATKVVFAYDDYGKLKSSFKRPRQLDSVYTVLSSERCASGASVRIPPNSLIDSNNRIITEQVQVNISTINLASPDGMPGDGTVRIGDRLGYMVSYGAVSVEIFYKDKLAKLKPGAKAELTIPVDSKILEARRKLSDSIPFLTYNENSGEWMPEGYAKLNQQGNAYTKFVTHFSYFNLDFVFAGGSCIQLNTSQVGGSADLKVKLVVPSFTYAPEIAISKPATCDDATCTCRFAFLRLPPDTPIGVVVSKLTSGVYSVIENFVIYTNSPGYDAMTIACSDYEQCVPIGTTGFDIRQFGFSQCNDSPITPCLITNTDITSPVKEVQLAYFYDFTDDINNQFVLFEAPWDPTLNSGAGGYAAYQQPTLLGPNVITLLNSNRIGIAHIAVTTDRQLTSAPQRFKFKVVAVEDFTGVCVIDETCTTTSCTNLCSVELEVNTMVP